MNISFLRTLIEVNRLDILGFRGWLFFPGMLFGSFRSWWGKEHPRPFSHEGIDLCFFEAENGKRYRLDASVRIPMAETGRIVCIIDDFIGKTIVCEYPGDRQANAPLYIIYAHVEPEKDLLCGDVIGEGECFAQIAEARLEKTPLPPHLHVSAVSQKALPQPDSLTWPFLNRLDRNAFADPAILLGLEKSGMTGIVYDPGVNIRDAFRPVRA